MEDSEFLCAKVVLRFDIRDQYILLSSGDLTICPKWTGNKRVYFSSYALSSDDRIEKEQGRPPVMRGDKLKPAIHGRGMSFSITATCLFAFLNSRKNSHHQGPLAKWVMGSWAVFLSGFVRWEALSALFVEIFISCIITCKLYSTQRKIFSVNVLQTLLHGALVVPRSPLWWRVSRSRVMTPAQALVTETLLHFLPYHSIV